MSFAPCPRVTVPTCPLALARSNRLLLTKTMQRAAFDEQHAAIDADCFPGRKIVGIDCRVLLIEGGALHCLSQQQPA